ncbi:MAG: hypothetical protein ABSD46_06940 [Bacteroidota bacterium]
MKKLSGKEYSEKMRGVKLNSVYLTECSAKVNRKKIPESLEIKIGDRTGFKSKNKKVYQIFHDYKLKAKGLKEKENFLDVDVRFCVEIASENMLEKDFFEIFSRTSLPMITYPYFREFVGNISGRMNVPPLTLPLIKRKG